MYQPPWWDRWLPRIGIVIAVCAAAAIIYSALGPVWEKIGL
jgi:hypothetical protein